MSTPARKSGRQSKPTEKFKEYLYGSDECEVPKKKDSISPIIGHIRTSKEKHIKPDTTNISIITKRGRPRKSIVDEDSLKYKNKESESEDENNDDDTKGNKLKPDVSSKKDNKNSINGHAQTSKERILKPDAASHTINRKRGRPRKSILEADLLKNKDIISESEDEDNDNDTKGNIKLKKEKQESGPRRSGRPPKLNERLLNYLHLDEGLLGESGHLSMKRKENSNMLSPKKLKRHVMSEESKSKNDEKVVEIGPAVRTVRNTSIGTKKALGKLKSISPQKSVGKEKEESITEIKKTMISRLLSMGNDISKKMLEVNTKTLLELSSHSSDNLDDPLAVLNLVNPTEDLDDETTEKILKWLDEEEKERHQYRQKLLESMKKSHEKTMEMYKQILKALE